MDLEDGPTAGRGVAFEDLPMNAQGPSTGPETLELSDTSKAAQEKHAQQLMVLEIEKKARSIFVPADIDEQKRMLRELQQPVTLFGEKADDRRDRLKKYLATRELAGAFETGTLFSTAGVTGFTPTTERQKELFYTLASEQLVEARKMIAQYSFERSTHRLRAQAAVASSPEACEVEDRHAARVYKTLKRMHAIASQAGDDRPLSSCALTPDSSILATSSWGSVINIWDPTKLEKRCMLRGHSDRVVSVVWHPAAGISHAASHPGTAAVHGTHTSQADAHLSGARGLLASGSLDGTAKLWRVPAEELTGAAKAPSLLDVGVREIATFSGHTLRLCNVAFHPSGRFIGTSSYDKTWRLWDVEHHHELLLQEGHARECYALAFHPDGSLAATGDLGGVGRVWDLRSGKSIFNLNGHSKQLLTLDFSPDGFHVASGSDDNTSVVWDLRQRKAIYTIPAHKGLVSKVRFAPVSGEFLVTSSFDGTIKSWSTRDFSLLGTYIGHDGKVTSFDIYHDEQQIVSVSFDRTIKHWQHDDSMPIL